MDLKFELDHIYSQVYSMNEASTEDQRILIAGFEDAINEGLGKWLGKVAGKITSAPSKIGRAIKKGYDVVKKGAVDLYNKGKELGTKAVDAVRDFFKKTGEKITDLLDQWGKKITEGWARFTQWCKETYDKIGDSLVKFWQAVKDKSASMVDAVSVFWQNMKNKLRNAYEATKKRFVDFGVNLKNWITENWGKLKEWSSEKYEGAVEWLRLKYEAAIDAIRAGKGKVTDAAKWIATWLVIRPYNWVAAKIKTIPELYKQFKAWLEKQAMEFKLGFEETAGRPFDRAKGFIIPPTFPDLNVSGEAPEEEDVTSRYDASKDPFSLGTKDEWKRLGLAKRTKSGKNNLQVLVEKYYDLKKEGLRDNEIVLSMGAWMVDNFPKSGVVTENSSQELEVKPGEEEKAEKLKEKIDAEKDERRLKLLKRELRSLMKYSDANVDEDTIGSSTIEVIDKVMEDPRISFYLDDADDKSIEKAVIYLSDNGMIDRLMDSKRDLLRILKDNGFTDKAAAALEKYVSSAPKKKKVMPLPEYEYQESMRYIMTFESFNRK